MRKRLRCWTRLFRRQRPKSDYEQQIEFRYDGPYLDATLLDLGKQLIKLHLQTEHDISPDGSVIPTPHSQTLKLEISFAEGYFLEKLIFSTPKELDTIIELFYGEFYDLPAIWMRHLTYRLACLQQPENAEIRRKAANDLYMHGPDWDEFAAQLEREAEAIEKPQ